MDGFGMWMVTDEARPVALTGVRMSARITALGQRMLVEQVFINREKQPIEAIYTFPLPEGAAVCGFEAITGERVLTGQIEEISQGMEQYDKAVGEGHGAFMAELWRSDVFSTRIGNLKPGQAVLIRLTYVGEIDLAERKLRVSIPTTMAPRYGTATGMDPVEALVEADALNPPHVLAVPYGLELKVEIDLGLRLKSVGSPTHGVRVETSGPTGWVVRLAAERTEMNRNVVIEAELAQESAAAGWVEDGVEPGEQFAAVSFLPEFEVAELEALGEGGPREVVFVLDCSGSMEGPSIEQAKRALALCLKCLNEGDRFNICRFGSTFELMKAESVAYTQASLDGALAYVGGIGANLGGTELHAPLQAVLQGADSRLMREIIVLTDGQVSNEPALVKLAAAHRGRARIFSFGIGPASSEFLVKGIATATGGAAEFVAPGERIEEKVLRMFGRMASPRLDQIEVDWDNAEADAEPRRIAALFDGEPLRVAARLRGAAPGEVMLTAVWQGKKKQWTVPLERRVERVEENRAGLIGAQWARRRLAALESETDAGMSEEQRKTVIVGLSKRYGILSKETTLIAIEHRSIEERTQGLPAQRRVPVMLAEGWGGEGVLYDSAAPAGAGGLVAHEYRFSMAPRCAAPTPPAAGGRVRKAIRNAVSFSRELMPKQESAGVVDPLTQLLLGQTAEGSFAWDDLLDHGVLNGRPWHPDPLRAEINGHIASLSGELKKKVLATALTLRAFRECFADKEDLWRMAAQKALRWLEKTAPAVNQWVQQNPAPTP